MDLFHCYAFLSLPPFFSFLVVKCISAFCFDFLVFSDYCGKITLHEEITHMKEKVKFVSFIVTNSNVYVVEYIH